MERKGASVGAKVGAFFGIQPAPGYITNPERQEHWERQHMIQMLKQRERMRARGQID
jgi:hypothetical protein